MPKKGAAAASKKNAAPSTSNDDGSYIIFGDDKSTKKKEKRAENQPAQGVKADEAQSSRDAAKKPETRQLIGGASWTGKLPVSLLSEHCQKQKWAKPEYTMVSEIVTKAPVPTANDTTPDQDIPGLLFWSYTESYKPKNSRNSNSTSI